MWAEVSRLNLVELVPALQMPVFFLLGRNDHWVPTETSVAYFDALTAPSKKLVWFEHSGHEPFIDEPAKFNAAMAEWFGQLCRRMSRHPERNRRAGHRAATSREVEVAPRRA